MKIKYPLLTGIFILWTHLAIGQVESDFHIYDNIQIRSGEKAREEGRFKDAIDHYVSAIAEDDIKNDALPYVFSLGQIGYCYRRLGDFENARFYLEKSEKEGIQLLVSGHAQMGLIYNHWAYFHYWNTDEKPDSALYFMKKSINVREKALPPNHQDLAQSYHGMGSMYMFLFSNYYEAATYYFKAAKIKEISNPESTTLAYSYLFLGQVLYELNDPQAALPYLKTSYRIYSAFPDYDRSYMESVVNSLGNVYYYLEEYSTK